LLRFAKVHAFAFKSIKNLILCNDFLLNLNRNKADHVDSDNCCNCNEAGTRVISRIHTDDVIYAQYKNDIFEVSYCGGSSSKM
jgi:hypothetical protein